MAGNGTMVWYMWLVEVPLQVGKYHLGLINKCLQWFKRRILRVNHEIYNGFGEVSWIFFLSYVNGHLTGRQLSSLGYAYAVGGIPQRPTVLGVYDGFCEGLPGVGTAFMGATGGSYCLQKRVGIRGRGEGQWLAWILDWAPYQRKCGRAHDLVVQQG